MINLTTLLKEEKLYEATNANDEDKAAVVRNWLKMIKWYSNTTKWQMKGMCWKEKVLHWSEGKRALVKSQTKKAKSADGRGLSHGVENAQRKNFFSW